MQEQADWDLTQARADELLAEGIWSLRSQTARSHEHVSLEDSGNYLITLDGLPQYIGEAKNIRARLRRQFTTKLSTFHKNHSRRNTLVEISQFRVQATPTRFGRKEIEEFGITNIPCCLNRFQTGKRLKRDPAVECCGWDCLQRSASELIKVGCDLAMAMTSTSSAESSPPSLPGIYLLRENNGVKPLYIGETSDLAERWHKAHCRSTYISALRRHVATDVLGFSLQVRNGKAKYLDDFEECAITRFLHSTRYSFMPINIGRFEIEECLIRKYGPTLNRKGIAAKIVSVGTPEHDLEKY